MLTRIADALFPAFGSLSVTADPADPADSLPRGACVLVANHTSLCDPVVVAAALRRLGTEPVIMAAAGLWRIPVLGAALARDGHIPVHRGTARAAEALDRAARVIADGRSVLLYGEGRLPTRRDPGEEAPGPFRSGAARLALAAGVPLVPVGQAGARRLCSGGTVKQLAGALTAPARRPRLHVHVGAALNLPAAVPEASAHAHRAVTAAWRTAVDALAASGVR
ncbi:lysophospholipid acyltransferase family protein [Streptomyces sp. NPDC048383]|uniref:lysophospholipid acyltransferase family protein n=1 Tax=Streptomyces sp. NPDC048383 TaxID=3155386 RepID=UPI0034365DFE